jgi:YD repeat-containing protein
MNDRGWYSSVAFGNGTLKTLAIVDSIAGTADSQSCTYQHDDVQRLASSVCGSTWTQNFTYDSFGNISKNGSSTFSPIYSSTTNRFTSIPGVFVNYDANGNLLTDNLNNYTWDVFGQHA